MSLFLEKGEGREKERERNSGVREKPPLGALTLAQTGEEPVTQACAGTRNPTSDSRFGG